jgi:hypothetical protein
VHPGDQEGPGHPLTWDAKKPRRQPFHVEATKLNFKACLTEGYSEAPRTEMLDYALTYVVRIHRSDDELHAMEGTPKASTSGPSTPLVTLRQE